MEGNMGNDTQISNTNRNDFYLHLDMLALTLSLRKNAFNSTKRVELLFSTYIKMIKNDSDYFFIDKKRQPNILTSLERSKAVCRIDKAKELENWLKNLRQDDPTDFLLLPASFYVMKDGKRRSHMGGLTILRKKNYYMVLHVDKEKWLNGFAVSYVQVAVTNVRKLSNILLYEPDFKEDKLFSVFRKIEQISEDFQAIPSIEMKSQTTGNCVVAEIEASLKTILYNCQIDLLSIDSRERVTPKWNVTHDEPTLEMRKRFLEAMKGENKSWNDHFDYLFAYYLYRKGQSATTALLPIDRQSKWWYQTVYKAFKIDPYVNALMSSGGKIPIWNEEDLQRRIKRELGLLHTNDIKGVAENKLVEALKFCGCLLSIFEERVELIKIPIAKEMNKRMVSSLEERLQVYHAEIKRRITIQKEKSQQTSSAQLFQFVGMDEKQKIEFTQRADFLALSLSLKSNTNIFMTPENHNLLLSIYIKMLKDDHDQFFIDTNRQTNIIQSLNRTVERYNHEKPENLKVMLENLRNNDPTDFLFFPANYFAFDSKYTGYVCGLTVYKKDDAFLILKVDKERENTSKGVSYVELSSSKVEELSKIIFSSKELLNVRPYETLKKIEAISHTFIAIPAIQLADQITNNGGVSEIETSLMMILFHCQNNLFELSEQSKITPKWNSEWQASTAEMRKRFLHAVKGENHEWNENFDYIFSYYECRNDLCTKREHSGNDQKNTWNQHINNLYRNDPYLTVVLNNGGKIPTDFVGQLKEILANYDQCDQQEIRKIDLIDLDDTLANIKQETHFLKERDTYNKIPIASKMNEYLIDSLNKKIIEIQREIHDRLGSKKTRQDRKNSFQLWGRKSVSWSALNGQKAQETQPATDPLVNYISSGNRLSALLGRAKQLTKMRSQDLSGKQTIHNVKDTQKKKKARINCFSVR